MARSSSTIPTGIATQAGDGTALSSPHSPASAVTATATARALRSSGLETITLVAMGNRTIVRTDEDEICAIHLRNLLEGRPGDLEAVRRLILAGGEIADFHDPKRPHLPPGDLDIALDIDRFDFAVAVTVENGRAVARKEALMASGEH